MEHGWQLPSGHSGAECRVIMGSYDCLVRHSGREWEGRKERKERLWDSERASQPAWAVRQ